jgi:hypothetical protein
MDITSTHPAYYKASLSIIEEVFRRRLGKISQEDAHRILGVAIALNDITDEALAFTLDLIADEFARNSFAGFLRTDGLAARLQLEQLRADKR